LGGTGRQHPPLASPPRSDALLCPASGRGGLAWRAEDDLNFPWGGGTFQSAPLLLGRPASGPPLLAKLRCQQSESGDPSPVRRCVGSYRLHIRHDRLSVSRRASCVGVAGVLLRGRGRAVFVDGEARGAGRLGARCNGQAPGAWVAE
jgi:hypothetical protein